MNSKSLLFFVLSFFSILSFAHANSALETDEVDCPSVTDYDALMALYNATGGDNWTNNNGWDVSCDLSTWHGVTVNGSGRVTSLTLSNNNLVGTLPSELGDLTSIINIYLENNLGLLGSSIPSEIGNLPVLKRLYLYNNRHEGIIPESFGNLSELTHLYLQNNRLSGSIPASLGNLTKMFRLYLQNNLNISGEIPSELGNYTSVQRIFLQNNQLTGSIPASLGTLSTLTHLFLNKNNLSGCIPEELSSLCGKVVNFTNNGCLSHGGDFALFCSGSPCDVLPQCACQTPQDYDALMALYNATDGDNWTNNSGWGQSCDLSTWYGVTTNSAGRVSRLLLPSNNLVGEIPIEVGDLSSLNWLYLDNNNLTGSIPSELGGYTNLIRLYLNGNDLTGSIPSELGALTSLQYLYLDNNSLSGTLPSELSGLSSLRIFRLQNNISITGPIPSSYGNMSSLITLHFGDLDLTGELPSSLSNISGLKYLYLYRNRITGTIPDSYGSFASMLNMYLYRNQLSGTIPATLGNLSTINKLYLFWNELEGCIPEELNNLCGKNINLTNNACLSHGASFASFCTGDSCEIPEECLNIDYALDPPTLGANSVVAGEQLTIQARIVNIGEDDANASIESQIGYYLSSDQFYDSNDVLLGTSSIPNLQSNYQSFRTLNATIPIETAAGDYHIVVYADENFVIAETEEISNNINSAPIEIEASSPQGPDYIISSIIPSSSTIDAGELINIEARIINQGDLDASAGVPSITGFYLSENESYEATDINLGTMNIADIQSGYIATNLLQNALIPSNLSTGTYFLIVRTDITNVVNNELDENNNEYYITININAVPSCNDGIQNQDETGIDCGGVCDECDIDMFIYAVDDNVQDDLYPGFFLGPSAVLASTYYPIPSVTMSFYLSHDEVKDQNDFLIGSSVYTDLEEPSLAQPFNIVPEGWVGEKYILFVVDDLDEVDESNEENNIVTRPVTILETPDVDYSGQNNFIFSSSNGVFQPGGDVYIGTQIFNSGTENATRNSDVRFYLSEDNEFDSFEDVFVSSFAIAPALEAGTNVQLSKNATIPSIINPGNYTVFTVVDEFNKVAETNESNNIESKQIVIEGPTYDYVHSQDPLVKIEGAYTTFDFLSSPIEGTLLELRLFISNDGNSAIPYDSDYIFYLSDDSLLDPVTDDFIGSFMMESGQGGGVNMAKNTDVTIPSGYAPGIYYLIGMLDADGDIAESDEGNNEIVIELRIEADPTCDDGIQNGNETGIDCGGSCGECLGLPDLVLSMQSIEPDSDISPGEGRALVGDLNNIGEQMAGSSTLIFFLSSDEIFGEDDIFLTQYQAGEIAPGASISFGSTFTLPYGVMSGTQYILAIADGAYIVGEEDELNNIVSIAINIEVIQTCFDGIQNQDETATDCGGVCQPCCISPAALDWSGSNYSTLFTEVDLARSIETSSQFTPGRINGNHSVSQSGAAIYNVPSMLPPGIKSMNPSLSLSYNSQAGDGPLGLGWDLSELSIISRVNKNLYLDNKLEEVMLDASDKFAIDGARLFSENGVYGADQTTYRPESEDFCRVTSLGSQGNGPISFTKETKDGLTYEYGGTADSRQLGADGETVIYWRVNRISDANENYIDFIYETNSAESVISKILYTGNSLTGQVPFIEVEFSYLQRGDFGSMYQNGTKLEWTKLLDQVKIKYDNEVVKRYQLNYGTDDINSFLQELIEYGEDGSQYNSTLFKYGENVNFEQSLTNVPGSGDDYSFVSGDFNGDGLTDILTLKKDMIDYNGREIESHSSYSLWLKNADDSDFTLVETVELPLNTFVREATKYFQESTVLKSSSQLVYDFDGDGRDDIIVMKQVFSDGLSSNPLPEVYTFNGTNMVELYSSFREFRADQGIHIGDFDGDSRPDFLHFSEPTQEEGGCVASCNYSNLYLSFPSKNLFNVLADISVIIPNAPVFNQAGDLLFADIRIEDFDGDGKSDVVIAQQEGDTNLESKVYTFDMVNDVPTAIALTDQSFMYPSGKHLVYQGDFNGDGKLDLLTGLETNVWEVGFSTGKEYDQKCFSFNQVPSLVASNKAPSLEENEYIITADFNGDNKSDVCHIFEIGAQVIIDIYYSTGQNFSSKRYSYNGSVGSSIELGDFNGDGKLDIISRPDPSSDTANIIYTNKNADNLWMTDVLDGFNNRISFEYETLNKPNSNVYVEENPINSFPINTRPFSLNVVSVVNESNGLNTGTNTTNYTYTNAITHREGRGFLGFQKVENTNQQYDRKKVVEYTRNSDFELMIPDVSETYVLSTNQLISRIEDEYLISQIGDSRRFWLRLGTNIVQDFVNQRRKELVIIRDENGNKTSETLSYFGLNSSNPVESISTVNTDFNSYGSWLPNKPEETTITSIRSGQDPFSQTISQSFNAKGLLVERIDFSGLDKQLTTSFSYDPYGNITESATSGIGLVERSMEYSFDPITNRFPITTTNALGQVASMTYHPFWGKPLTSSSIELLTSEWSYDGFGREINTTSTTNVLSTTQYLWDVRNGDGTSIFSADNTVYYIQTSAPHAPTNKTWYDAFDRPRQITKQAFKSGDGDYENTILMRYDERGRVIQETNDHRIGDSPLIITHTYDEYNRLININTPIGDIKNQYSANPNGEFSTTTTQLDENKVSVSITDASDKEIRMIDAGGVNVVHNYLSNGQIGSILTNDVTNMTMSYDLYARPVSMSDISAGTLSYDYNAFGELVTETDARGSVFEYSYDILGRMTQRNRNRVVNGTLSPETTTTYDYVSSGAGVNQLRTATYSNVLDNDSYIHITELEYDGFSRPIVKTETINGEIFTTSMSLNEFSELTEIVYPSNLKINYQYDDIGNLVSMLKEDGALLFKPLEINSYGQLSKFESGNGLITTTEYNEYGILNSIKTDDPSIFNLSFEINNTNGNVLSRTDGVSGQFETFSYDNEYDRLIEMNIGGNSSKSLIYDDNGNISNKSDVSPNNYQYDNTKIHALTQINSPNPISTFNQDIKYNSDHQPFEISNTEGYNLAYTYGLDGERRYAKLLKNEVEEYQRYYLGSFERDIKSDIQRDIHYLSGGVIVVIEDLGLPQYYYSYDDHLSSITTVTNETGEIIANQSFDAWGRKRSQEDWTSNVTSNYDLQWLYRGYTGHEMLPEFDLINMNGRLYDPVVGRMLSPDKYVGQDGTSQGYNRYTYAYNNPLKYSDPTGETPALEIFAAVATPFVINEIGNRIGGGFGRFLQNVGRNINIRAYNNGGGYFSLFRPDRPILKNEYLCFDDYCDVWIQISDLGGDDFDLIYYGGIHENGGLVVHREEYRVVEEGTLFSGELGLKRKPGSFLLHLNGVGNIKSLEGADDPFFTILSGGSSKFASSTKLWDDVANFGFSASRHFADDAARGLWSLSRAGASKVKNHKTFGTFYKSKSDGLWWAVDKAGHGDSKFKVFRETKKGLVWFKDADEYGDFIIGKHKGDVGKFIPWGQFKTIF